jgi:serine/threonine-protein kinase
MKLTAETALHNGKYVLDTQLGQGVFSLTYRATNTESGQTVVIKTLAENLRQHSDFAQFKQQFIQLADHLKSCKHPNLVQILDYFEDAGRPYLVMEYISGQTLAELIQSDVLPEAKAIEYIRQIGKALSVLHQAGLLHRDVKPQNIIRRQDTNSVVLCEFGITCEFTPGMMQTHASLLSAGYAPPEQYAFEGQRTRATDIYALAATLYCLLTGRPPLPAPVRQARHSDGGKCLFLPNSHPAPPNLSPAIKEALWRGLELAVEKRPQTVEAWLSLLKSQKKIPKPQLALTQRSKAKPKAQKSVQATSLKPAATKPQTPQIPRQEKIPKPEPALFECLVVKPKAQKSVQADLKPTPTNRHTPQMPPKPEKKSTPQLAFAQHLVIKLKTLVGNEGTASTKSKTPNGKLPLRSLLMTGAIAASVGMGFGLALRLNRPAEPGSTILHTKQAFPPSSNWPMSEPRL